MPRATTRPPTRERRPLSADAAALRRLVAGYGRFVASERLRDDPGRVPLAQLAKGQRPFATILGSSDSRVPPELLFDQGFGDLFIVRVAGNIVSAEVLGTLQYAGAHWRRPSSWCWGPRAAERCRRRSP